MTCGLDPLLTWAHPATPYGLPFHPPLPAQAHDPAFRLSAMPFVCHSVPLGSLRLPKLEGQVGGGVLTTTGPTTLANAGNGNGNGQLEASPSLYYQGATAFRNNAWQQDFDPACKVRQRVCMYRCTLTSLCGCRF